MSFALNPTDLPPYGITHTPTPGPSLPPLMPTSAINPVFAPRNFTCKIPYQRLMAHTRSRADEIEDFELPITLVEYNRMLPAFALASNFITHSQSFLYTVRNAPLTTSTVNGRRKRHFQPPLSSDSFQAAQKTQIAAQLTALAPRIRYLTAFPAALLDASADTIPLLTAWRPSPTRRDPYPTPQTALTDDTHYLTSLPCELLNLLGGADWTSLSPGARRRILFQLAVTLVHELVHALYWERRFDASLKAERGDANNEPYFRAEDPVGELGEAWEVWFFGGLVEMPFDGDFAGTDSSAIVHGPAGMRVPTYALRWRSWVEGGVVSVPIERVSPWEEDERWVLVSGGVEGMFDKERWVRFGGMVADVDGRVSIFERGEGPLQVSFAPLRTGNTILMDRGVEDNRSVEERRKPDEMFDILLDRCAAGEFSRLPGSG